MRCIAVEFEWDYAYTYKFTYICRMGGMVVINVLVSSAVDREFEPRSDRHQQL
jgi:hypothetical protein